MNSLKTVLKKAVAILMSGTILLWCLQGSEFAGGFLMAGVLTVASLVYGWWLTREAADGTLYPEKTRVLVAVKFPVFCMLAWGLLMQFPPLSIALGGTVLVAAITMDALDQLLTAVSTREA